MSSLHPIIQFSLEQGIPLETLQFLLLLPLVVTFIAFFRQVVGIKAFGIYTPTLIVFSFLAIGLKYGIAIYLIVIFVSLVVRFLLKSLRLLSLVRIAITLTIVSFALFLFLLFGATLARTGFASVSIVPLIIMIVLSEKFISAQAEKNTKIALFISFQTLVISIFTYALVQLPAVTEVLLRYPWLVLLTLPINFFFGRWTGLRLTEYIRFRSLLKKS